MKNVSGLMISFSSVLNFLVAAVKKVHVVAIHVTAAVESGVIGDVLM